MHNMCLVRPVLLYLNVHVLKVFYEQINSFIHISPDAPTEWLENAVFVN